jgi:hypothetical protein
VTNDSGKKSSGSAQKNEISTNGELEKRAPGGNNLGGGSLSSIERCAVMARHAGEPVSTSFLCVLTVIPKIMGL